MEGLRRCIITKFVGRRGSIALAKESSRGTATVTSAIWVPWATIDFDDKVEAVRETQAFGRRASGDSSYVTQQMGEGKIEAELYDKALGLILSSLLGSAPVTTGSNPYTHTFTLSNSNQNQSLSILYQDPDTAKIFPLGVVDSCKITVDQNAIVKYEVSFKSKVGRDWTLQTASFTSLGSKFLHQHLSFKTAATVGALSGSTAISLKKLELEIKNNTIFDSVLGTVEPEDILSNEFSVSGNIELFKQDETYRRLMLDGTYKAMEIKFTGSASSSLQLQFPRTSWTEWEQDRKLNDIVGQKINFEANYDAANALEPISTCVLVNTQTSY